MTIDTEAVYSAVRAIPPGTVTTYGELAEQVGLTRNHARAIGNVLRSRPDNDAWMTTPPEDHDVPWRRVVKADGSLQADEQIEDEDTRRWVGWARRVLMDEGVAFTNDGRVASLADAHTRRGDGRGTRSSATKRTRLPEPCWRHDTVQYSCRDCAPGQ